MTQPDNTGKCYPAEDDVRPCNPSQSHEPRPDEVEGQGEADNRGQPARGGRHGENPSAGQRTSQH